MRNILLTISLLFLFVSPLAAQTQSSYLMRIDSIRHTMPSLKDKQLLEAYYKIYNLYYYAGDVQRERQSIDDLLEEAEHQKDVKMQGTARTALLYYYYNNDLNDSLLSEFPKQQEFFLKNSDWKFYYDTWILIVNHYIFTSQSNTALREVKKMYEDARKRENQYGIGLASYGMGNAYMDIGFHEEAIQAYERCIKTLRHFDAGSSTLLDVYPYYCSVLSEVKNYKRMLEVTDLWHAYLDSHRKELGLDSEKSANSSYYTYCYNSRATALMGLGRLQEAEDLLMKAYEATKDVRDNAQLTVFYNMGQLYSKMGDYQKALDFNNHIMGTFVDDDDVSGRLMIKKQRAEIMLQSHRFEEAASLYKEVFFLADSLNINSVRNQLNEFNTLFKVNELEKEHQQAKARQAYVVLGVIIAALLLVGLLGVYFMNRLRQKNRELAIALDHAQESDRMKTSFIQHISHEIRTPLNVITGFSQVIGNPSFKLSTEERAHIVESINTNTHEITNFVNELLEFSENESQNHYVISDCIHVNPFCQEIMKMVEVVNNGRLELIYEPQVDDRLTVDSNRMALERILKQLLNNALKFTEKGSVRLRTRVTDDGTKLEIAVADTGIGIPEDKRERIFEKFYKVDSFKPGLGLGLPMAYRIAHMLGGDLTLNREYSGGACFLLTIPLNNPNKFGG
ncbi:MAG: tetratricopeptide repeat-containing sensor histidine kinase [Prevotella sp.]|nr:tetratricopeptide repeat-containing sensor histidine kinase [Prevotella sp.]